MRDTSDVAFNYQGARCDWQKFLAGLGRVVAELT
jgi:hypothetical protein